MIITVAADLHITEKCPKNRIDDYYQTVLKKFEFILQSAEDAGSTLLLAGDIFDRVSIPYHVLGDVFNVMNTFYHNGLEVFVVPGQHDLRYHRHSLTNTPLGVLAMVERATVLKPNEAITLSDGKTTVIGCGWEETPEVEADILMMHKMIVKDGPLFPGQVGYTNGLKIMRDYPWAKCIITGDNHLPHIVKSDTQLHINCGSMMRSNKGQVDFKPAIHEIDTETWENYEIPLPIAPKKKVFDFNKINTDKIKDTARDLAEKEMDSFLESINDGEISKPNFEEDLAWVIKKTSPTNKVVTIINDIMEEY